MSPLNAPPISAAAEESCFPLQVTEKGRDYKKRKISEGDYHFYLNFEC